MKIKGLIRIAASVAALFALSGCLQNEVTVHVKSDGSGTVVEETVLGAQMSAMLGGMGGMMQAPDGKPAKNPVEEMISEEKAKERAAAMGDGVTVEKIEKIDKDGKTGARIIYAFKDVNQLKLSLNSGAKALDGMPGKKAGKDGEKAEDKAEEAPVRFKFEDGKLTILMPKPDEDAKTEKPEGAPKADDVAKEMKKDPQAEAMMKAMFADMKMAVRVVVEPGIEKTDATYADGKTITLMEMNFGEIIQNEKGMEKLDKLEGKTSDEVAELLKGIKGVKIETRKQIDVQMK